MSNYKYALDENKELILTKNNDSTLSDSEGSESVIGEPVDEPLNIQTPILEESPSIQQENPPISTPDLQQETPNLQENTSVPIPVVQMPTLNSQFTPINSLSQVHPDLEEMNSPVSEEMGSPVSEEMNSPVSEEMGSPVSEEMNSPVSEEMGSPVSEEMGSPVSEEMGSPVSEENQNVLVVSEFGNDAGDAYDTQNLPDFLDFLGHLNETNTVAQVDAMGQSNFRGTIVQDFPLEWMIYVVSFQKEHNSEVVGHLINWMFYMLTRTQIDELINPVDGSYIKSLMDTFGIKFNYNNE
jgi:hypothetical protein